MRTNSMGTPFKEEPRMPRKSPKVNKVERVMHEFKEGELHSGSKKGKKVTSRAQAVAIGLSEQRKQEKGKY
jgi:hypothetical protein